MREDHRIEQAVPRAEATAETGTEAEAEGEAEAETETDFAGARDSGGKIINQLIWA